MVDYEIMKERNCNFPLFAVEEKKQPDTDTLRDKSLSARPHTRQEPYRYLQRQS